MTEQLPIFPELPRYRLELVLEETSKYHAGRFPLTDPERVAGFITEELGTRPQEHMAAIFTDTRNNAIGWGIFHIGTRNRAAVEPAGILKAALELNATGFILTHTHPSGDPTPSAEDLAFTRRLANAGEVLGIRLIDHIIVGTASGRWISLRNRGWW
jgi:DNA repair protein RadC